MREEWNSTNIHDYYLTTYMPLFDGYGVLIGQIERHFIDPPDNEGRWPHYHIQVKHQMVMFSTLQ
jgi:hypothetical protein